MRLHRLRDRPARTAGSATARTTLPRANWRDGITSGFVGNVPNARLRERIHRGSPELLTLASSPLLRPLFDLGATNVEATFEPVLEDLFAFKEVDTTRDEGSFQMGPWNTESRVEPIGALRTVPNVTLGLPMRPEIGRTIRGKHGAEGLYVPSDALLRKLDDFDDPEVNFSEKELAWNHGASQDEHELKEAYLDIELFDSRLWLRVGKQTIVWGKTELFRTTDQFNPQDVALSLAAVPRGVAHRALVGARRSSRSTTSVRSRTCASSSP